MSKHWLQATAAMLPQWRGIEHMPRLYDWSTRRSETGLIKLRRKLLGNITGDVLEMGVGTGHNLPHYNPDTRVVAFDLDPANVHYAVDKPGTSHAQFLAANAQMLPFVDATFDHVVATLVLCSVPSQMLTLAEVARVLRPGGRLHLIEHTLTGKPPLDWLLHQVERPWGWVTGGCHPNRDIAVTLRSQGWKLLMYRRYSGGFMNIIVALPGT